LLAEQDLWWYQMAGQGWSFDALDHGIDYQQNGLDVQGATWADLEDAYELGEHW
jgi:hypothetical protein